MANAAATAVLNATEAYQELIGALAMAMPKPAPRRLPNWADVGSILHANAKLAEVLAFLTGTEE